MTVPLYFRTHLYGGDDKKSVYKAYISFVPQSDGSYSLGIADQPLQYLGEDVIVGNGAAQIVTIPDGTKLIKIESEGGVAYYAINGTASSGSGGYIPQDQTRWVGPYSNLESLSIFAEVGVSVHLIFEG